MLGFKTQVEKVYRKLFGRYSLSFLLSKELDNETRILDAGCGYSSNIRLVRKGSYRVGLDFSKPYILESKKLFIHDDYVLADVRALPFKPKSFDYAVAIEVLEHLDKHDGPKMLEELSRVAVRKIILTTPNDFLPLKTHVSGWRTGELEELGFQVYGLGGWKRFWKIESVRATLRSPLILFALLAGISEIFVYRRPSLAFTLFGLKKQ